MIENMDMQEFNDLADTATEVFRQNWAEADRLKRQIEADHGPLTVKPGYRSGAGVRAVLRAVAGPLQRQGAEQANERAHRLVQAWRRALERAKRAEARANSAEARVYAFEVEAQRVAASIERRETVQRLLEQALEETEAELQRALRREDDLKAVRDRLMAEHESERAVARLYRRERDDARTRAAQDAADFKAFLEDADRLAQDLSTEWDWTLRGAGDRLQDLVKPVRDRKGL